MYGLSSFIFRCQAWNSASRPLGVVAFAPFRPRFSRSRFALTCQSKRTAWVLPGRNTLYCDGSGYWIGYCEARACTLMATHFGTHTVDGEPSRVTLMPTFSRSDAIFSATVWKTTPVDAKPPLG